MVDKHDQPDQPPTEIQQQLDEAARAYMAGEYDTATSAWEKVLSADPENIRAREGIKKVHMLSAEDSDTEPVPSFEDPILIEVQELLEKRLFEDAVHACKKHAEMASPALLSSLHELEQRAERGRASEPEIVRCLTKARRHLREGNVREAVPELKQVLDLDKDHPLAARLMQGIRERARKRAGKPSPSQEARPRPVNPKEMEIKPLPASGNPGSDAMTSSPDVIEDMPAPPGSGLPSSPLFEDLEDSPAEIEMEMISLQDETPGTEEPQGPTDVETSSDRTVAAPDDTVSGGDESTAVEDEVVTSDDDLVIGDVDEIQLEPESLGTDSSHRLKAGFEAESPFHIENAGPAGQDEPEEKAEEQDAIKVQEIPEEPSPVAEQPPDLGLDDDLLPDPGPLPPVPRAASPRGSRLPMVLAVLGLLAAGAAAAWWFGYLPGLSSSQTPAPQVTQPAPQVTNPKPENVQGETGQQRVETRRAPQMESSPRVRQDPRAALELFEKGQDYFEAGRFEEAGEMFKQAVVLDPVNPEIVAWQSKTAARVQEQRQREADHTLAVDAFRSRDFETALRKFYRLEQKNPDGPYETYIVTSWYNWGLQFLAAGNLREADRKMDEVLAMRPDDQDAKGVKQLIADYVSRAKDRIFYARIEALRYRVIEG